MLERGFISPKCLAALEFDSPALRRLDHSITSTLSRYRQNGITCICVKCIIIISLGSVGMTKSEVWRRFAIDALPYFKCSDLAG